MNGIIFTLALAFLIFFIWYLATTTEKTRLGVSFALIFTLVGLCGVSLFQKDDNGEWKVNIKQGIDLKGGMQFIIEVKGGENGPSPAALDQAVETISKRVNRTGVSEPIIQPMGKNRIIVQIPGEDQTEKYRTILEKVAKLEFKLVHPLSSSLIQKHEQGDATAIPFDFEILNFAKKEEGQPDKLVVKKRALMTGKYVTDAYRGVDQVGLPTVEIRFKGASKFGEVSSAIIEECGKLGGEGRMAIVLDNEVYTAPGFVDNKPIYSDGCSISGGKMSPEEAEQIASVLENPLETPVSIEDERTVASTLGASSIKSGFYAAMIGFVTVMIFMAIYYRKVGTFAVVALLLNLFFLLGMLAQFDFTLTLPGVAGIILTIGIAVDANVLIFERIREELDSGTELKYAVSAGFNKAFSSILDANVTTLIASVIMFWQGSGAIRGFAVVLSIGILTSMFSALIVTRTGFDWLLSSQRLKAVNMMRLLSKTSFNFIGMRGVAGVVAVIMVILTVGTLVSKGNKSFGVDFVGGDLMTLSFEERIPQGDLVSKVNDSGVVIQYQKSLDNTDEILSIKGGFGEAEKAQVKLAEAYPEAKFKVEQLDRVKPTIGDEFRKQAITALVLGLIGIFIYVMWRFEFSFAIGAICALLHDVAITLGLFSLFGYEFSLVIVGAILTIAGYSINDTIVVFDRIREGLKHDRKTSMGEIINRCLNATLSRTLLTSGTTLLAVVALLVFGGLVIRDFAFMLLIGVLIGTFSSIFIASPIVLFFGEQARKSISEKTAAAAVAE